MAKKQELEKVKSQNEKLLKRIAEERQKVSGYEEIAKVYSAYIAILLNKLGATKDNTITITAGEVTKALKMYEARAIQVDGGYGLYCDAIKLRGSEDK